MELYTVRDKKQNMYFAPTCSINLTQISRALTEVVNDPSHTFNKYTSDFELFRVGTFDQETGILVGNPEVFVMNLTELKYQQPEVQK